jgi:hypothetical protein
MIPHDFVNRFCPYGVRPANPVSPRQSKGAFLAPTAVVRVLLPTGGDAAHFTSIGTTGQPSTLCKLD